MLVLHNKMEPVFLLMTQPWHLYSFTSAIYLLGEEITETQGEAIQTSPLSGESGKEFVIVKKTQTSLVKHR